MKAGSLTLAHNPLMIRKLNTLPVGAGLVALAAVAGGAGVLKAVPWLKEDVFVGGSAGLASLFSGAATVRTEAGWELLFSGQPVLVTSLCGATDFFLMVTALLGWHFARRAPSVGLLPLAMAGAILAAVPLTLFVNALRLVAVAHAHRWVIPRMPEVYDAFLHMLTGVAVFLPALIALNLLFEIHGRSCRTPSHD